MIHSRRKMAMAMPKRSILTTACTVVMIFCFLCNGAVTASPGNDFYTVKFKDSVSLDAKSKILYNTVYITNTSRQAVTLQVSASMPAGWRLLGDEQTGLSFAPGEKKMLSMAIIRLPAATAVWQPVSIIVKADNSADTTQYRYYIRTNTLVRFKAMVRASNLTIADREQESCIPVKITNTGTVDGMYNVTLKCKRLEIDEQTTITIRAHADSDVTFCLKVPKDMWRTFTKESLLLEIHDTAGHIYTHTVNMSRVGSNLKMHRSPFETFPLTLEGGILNVGNVFTYYGAMHGQAIMDDGDKLSFAYRSKQFGPTATFQKNIWNVEYDRKKWLFSGGTISDNRFFALFNTGAKITHKWNENGEISICGTMHDNLPASMASYNNDNLTASLKYSLKKVVFSHVVVANFNPVQRLNGYILENKVRLIKTRNVLLEVSGGAGLEQSTFSGPNTSGSEWGSAFGYLFTCSRNKWSIISNIRENSQTYPGLMQGFKMQNHLIIGRIGSFNLGFFYQSNYNQTNFFRDTIYHSDAYENNSVKYGGRLGWSARGMGITLESGILSQQGSTNTIGPQYPYAQLSWNYRKKDFTVRISSLNGYTNRNGDVTQDLWISTSSLAVNLKHFGCDGTFVRAPIVSPKEKEPVTGFDQTLNCTPYVIFCIGKRLNAQFHYALSRSVYDNSVKTFIGGNLTYRNDRQGMNIRLFGTIPLQNSVDIIPGLNSRYMMLSMSKRLEVPNITQRKFYDLKVVTYFDQNANGKWDDDEPLLQHVSIDINGATFVTDEHGCIKYSNVERGTYTIDLHNGTNIRGIMPSGGFTQQVNVTKNTRVEIPFKKSKVISGRLKVVLDSLSPMSFRPDYVKITATDTSGETFVTATDEAGEFFFNLPAGIYSVSLNPKAFTGKMKPLRMAYKIDLVHNEEASVTFELDQKNREIRVKTFKIDK